MVGLLNIQIDGEKHKVLIAEGYINQQRYPHFVEWLENKINDEVIQYMVLLNLLVRAKIK